MSASVSITKANVRIPHPEDYGKHADGVTIDAYSGDVDKQHEQMVRWFEESEMARMDEIELAQRDREYFDHDQWTKPELDALKARGQPPIVINKIHDKVCAAVRPGAQGAHRPQGIPPHAERGRARRCGHPGAALHRRRQQLRVIRSQVFEHMLVEGAGGAELGLEDDGQGGADITITHVPWDRIWYDPHSRQLRLRRCALQGPGHLDGSRPAGGSVSGRRRRHRDARSVSTVDWAYNDRPDNVLWTDNQRQRVRVVQCHWSERGTWWTATFTKHGMLADTAAVPVQGPSGKSAPAG